MFYLSSLVGVPVCVHRNGALGTRSEQDGPSQYRRTARCGPQPVIQESGGGEQSSMHGDTVLTRTGRPGPRPGALADVAVAIMAAMLAAMWLNHAAAGSTANVLLTGFVLAVITLPVAWRWRPGPLVSGLGAANRVTLVRAVPVALFVGYLPVAQAYSGLGWWLALAAALTLALDGVDGWTARRYGASRLGARFDMELDALFILALAAWLAALGKVGYWVLLVGAVRYLFVVAGWLYSPLRAPLPVSFRRKAVCVWQVLTLLAGLVPLMPSAVLTVAAAIALALLTVSFAVDVAWLLAAERQRKDFFRGGRHACDR